MAHEPYKYNVAAKYVPYETYKYLLALGCKLQIDVVWAMQI
jgi:hypothetical protein